MYRFKKAFTLIELLVVIAIIAILAAILFPVFAQAKQAAKKTQSLSNVKQQALGIMMYAGDADDMLPVSERSLPGGTNQIQWYGMVYPYIKAGQSATNSFGETEAWGNDGIWEDPMFPDKRQGQHYGVNLDLCPSNYNGVNDSAVSATAVDRPADKVLILNKGKNGESWGVPFFSSYQWFWTPGLGGTGGASENNPGGSAIASGQLPRDGGYFLNRDANVSSGGCSNWEGPECEVGRAPRFRYNGVAVGAYVDGHATTPKRGQLKWFLNIAHRTSAYPWNQSWYPY